MVNHHHVYMNKMDSYYYLTVLYILIIPSLCVDWTSNCPWNCTCKWTNGKKSAICNTLDLKTVPTELSTELQVLALNENDITYLHRSEFTTLGLVNLQKIYIKKSNVQYVDKDAFRDLKILIEIDLSENEIKRLDKNTFFGNVRLRVLLLNGNPIKTLVAEQFPKLPHLRYLDLHNCLLQTIDSTSFQNLELLEYLNMKHNLLENLNEKTFSHMNTLKTLLIYENPWKCDCKLRKFRDWYLKSNLKSISLTCKNPFQIRDHHWETINEDNFGCRPIVELYNNLNQTDDIGGNITYSCLVYGDPQPDISWILNGKILYNENIVFSTKHTLDEKIWSNTTIVNVSNYDAGIYSCVARNNIGFSSANISLILDEVVERVIEEPPKTFLLFRLIISVFCTIFGLIFIAMTVCFCQKAARKRKLRKNIKGSVSFNDQEKKLLDLSITTNERQDSCENTNTPSTNKAESIIALEPVQITIENKLRNEEFPLNVGVFPPPPEFCSNIIQNPAYGNIFISVSVTQDALNNHDLNMYPDLLNIPNRKFVPINVSSHATLPRKNRPSTLDNQLPNEEIVNYQNLEVNFDSVCSDGNADFDAKRCSGNKDECSKFSLCAGCLKNQIQGHYVKGEDFMKCEGSYLYPKYDNMGRRVTASGNSTLSLPDDELIESEIIYCREADINEIPTPPLPPICAQSSGSDFVSL